MSPETREILERIEMHCEQIASDIRLLTRDDRPIATHSGDVRPWEIDPDDTKPQARCLYEDEPPSRAVT